MEFRPHWNEQYANSPDLRIVLSEAEYPDYNQCVYDIYLNPNPKRNKGMMLISTNLWPWCRFVYITYPEGKPQHHGALGGEYKLTDGTTLKTKTGWSSRAGVLNSDAYIDHLPGEIIDVTLYKDDGFPHGGMAGWAFSAEHANRKIAQMRDVDIPGSMWYLVRDFRSKGEPVWTPSLSPNMVVKPLERVR